MVKAYFYLKDVFNEVSIPDGNDYLVKFTTVQIGGVEQLTAFYTAETTSNYVESTSFELSDCSDDGTQIDACEIGGLDDSWNPFFANMVGQWDNVVNTKNRGAFLQSDSGNFYGLEGLGIGFDKILVPINDVTGGGSTGASAPGAFYMNVDETQDFSFTIEVIKRTPADQPFYTKEHRYSWNATTCHFSYLIETISGGSGTVDATEWAFLSGGIAGWADFSCGSTGGDLGDDPIVTRSICTVPKIPSTPGTIVDEALDECCYQSPVLASTTSNDDWKNDINSFLFKRNFSSESITLTLEKNGVTDLPINNDDFGIYYDFGTFGDFPNYKGIQIQWQKVLLLEGSGTYRIKAEYNLITGPFTEYSIPFVLNEYTQDRANGTFRIQSVQNGYLRHSDFDFTGLDWLDGIRIRGFFGNRQAEYEQENVLYANRQSKQIRSELINTYVCQTMHIPDCITDQIIEYHNFANTLFFTDYNLNNHKKSYIQKEVVFDSMESIEYKDVTHFAPLELKYKDKVQNYVKTNC
jgi:hypothetical protein